MASLYLRLAICATCFIGGWVVNGWRMDSQNSAAVEAVRIAEAGISQRLELELQKLRTNEHEIIREIPKIIERPVYRNHCIDDRGLLLINKSKNGSAEFAD